MRAERLSRVRGLTAVELLIVLAIAAILASIAVPSFAPMIERYRGSNASNEMLRGLMLARSNALGLGDRVVLAPYDGGNWQSGWRVFVDLNNNGRFDAATDREIQASSSLGGALVNASAGFGEGGSPFVSFNNYGFPRGLDGVRFADGNFVVRVGDTARAICLEAMGRARVVKGSACD